MERRYSAADLWVLRLHQRIAAMTGQPTSPAPYPAAAQPEHEMSAAERRHAAGLMRVNHAGEIAAQALYHGQALTARSPQVREHLLEAADEEAAHLQWCERRLGELGATPSKLQPLWYAGSFVIGAAAGLAGDKWSLGFVAETEKQVSAHLEEHLRQLPEHDQRSRHIVRQMHADETRHGAEAEAAGGRALPATVQRAMQGVARVMKLGAYWV